ncbi:MAG: hypothetical protein HYT03_01430 [Candidatus Harrisonbacteria bacterium]|nr:hypothetical protein [Candidatus Harrisonbacteria bacterium]
MGESIANPKAMKASQVLGRFSECYRRLEEAGLTFTDLQYPIDDPEFRDRLVEFWKNRGELTLPKPASNWQEQDGVIYFSVTSDGTTGLQWIKRLEGNGFHLGNYAKKVLRSSDFKPTNGMTTEVVVLKGMLFEDNDRITKKIRAEADKRKLSKPNAELACLIQRVQRQAWRQVGS